MGFKPKTPLKDAGRITEPPVWVPRARGIWKSATLAPEPADEPPGEYSMLWGLRVLLGFILANSLVIETPGLGFSFKISFIDQKINNLDVNYDKNNIFSHVKKLRT